MRLGILVLGAVVLIGVALVSRAVLGESVARLEGLRNISISDPIIWWGTAANLLTSSSMKPPFAVSLLGLVPHLIYLVGVVLLARALVLFGHSAGRDWRPFKVGVLVATASVLTAAPSWFWGVTGLFFSVPPAIIEVLAVGFVCALLSGTSLASLRTGGKAAVILLFAAASALAFVSFAGATSSVAGCVRSWEAVIRYDPAANIPYEDGRGPACAELNRFI